MTFHEPTSDGLKAQAGWALVKRIQSTPEHAVALDKYRDGCEALVPYANSGTAEQSSGEVKLPVEVARPSRFEKSSVPQPDVNRTDADRIAAIVKSYSTVNREIPVESGQKRTWDGPCQHRFNIADNLCVYGCGTTKRQALAQRGRKPELIEP